ncbi:uncharacterized protein DUF4185 [Mumia flava]|uniref:Uncharacterized protein DUF4185 n=1 Tax=Mumia flava TaxID=1348852 RepID=A0A0B2BNV0_9ACTN|nr:DUF4185 domain-containing protein [Mumia flava]PJJ56544.1 uncharacterized protein DUF4185 [Mumia flava]
MTGWRRVVSRPVLVLLVLLPAVAALALTAALRTPEQPHRVPIQLVAPPLVATTLAAEANDLANRPFDAAATDDADAARADVADGTAVASIEVDLAGTQDTLVVNRHTDDALADAVRKQIDALEQSYGRTVTVEEVTADGVGPAPPGRGHAYALVLSAILLGFGTVVVISLARGPVALTLRLGVVRLVGIAAASVAGGIVLPRLGPLTVPGEPVAIGVSVALGVAAAATITLALESLAGLAGLGLAAITFLAFEPGLLRGTDPALQNAPWNQVSSVLPSGALLDAVTTAAFYGGTGWAVAIALLVTWVAVAVMTSITARFVRARYGITLDRLGPIHPPPDPSDDAAPTHPTLWRLRVLAVVVPVAVLALAATALVPSGGSAEVARPPSRATETECLATGDVTSVADLNRIASDVRGAPQFQGGDVGADVELSDGRRLMLFGDTLRAPDFDGQRFVRNSMLVFQPDCAQVVVPADHGALIPDRGDGVGYWPMSVGAVAYPGYDLVAVATQRVRTTGATALSFENLGPSFAIFVVRPGQPPQLVAQGDIGPDDPDPARPTWGAASAVHDGWVYLYGTARPVTDGVFGFSLSLARVRPENILEHDRWRYWDGRRWSREAGEATELIGAEGGVSQTLSVFESDGTWYALSKRDEFLGDDLVLWSAPAPTGPFTAQPPVAQLPSDTTRGLLRYMPLAHPDLLPRKDTVVVSYSRNRTDVDEVIDNPLRYRPRFLRVPLP